MLNVPVNNFSVMCYNTSCNRRKLMCLAKGHSMDRTQDLSIRSPTLYHYATAIPMGLYHHNSFHAYHFQNNSIPSFKTFIYFINDTCNNDNGAGAPAFDAKYATVSRAGALWSNSCTLTPFYGTSTQHHDVMTPKMCFKNIINQLNNYIHGWFDKTTFPGHAQFFD